MCRIQLKLRFWLHEQSWHISCKFQLEIRSNVIKKWLPKIVWQTYMKYTVAWSSVFLFTFLSVRPSKDLGLWSVRASGLFIMRLLLGTFHFAIITVQQIGTFHFAIITVQQIGIFHFAMITVQQIGTFHFAIITF